MSSVASCVTYKGGLTVEGWVSPTRPSDSPLRILAQIRGKTLTQVDITGSHDAAQPLPFSLILPLKLADGRLHQVDVLTASGHILRGSPLNILCYAEGEATYFRQHVAEHVPQEKADAFTALLAVRQNALHPFVDLAQYADWFALFGHIPSYSPSAARHCTALIIPSPNKSATKDIAITLNSLMATSLPNEICVLTPPDDSGTLAYQQARSWINTYAERGGKPFTLHFATNASEAGRHLPRQGFTLMMEAGDHLARHALSALTHAAADNPDAVIYSDHDTLTCDGMHAQPVFKPGWDTDLFINENYLEGTLLVPNSIVHACLATTGSTQRGGYLRQLSYDLVGACELRHVPIKHLPYVACHRHTNASPWHSPHDARRVFKKIWPDTLFQARQNGTDKATWPLARQPLISIIIPTKDKLDLLQTCIDSITQQTLYPNYELLIIDNQSEQPDTLAYLKQLQSQGHTVLHYPHPFNYSAINNFAARHAEGEVLLLLNNDTEVLTPAWLDEMVSLLLREDVGIVGAKLLWPNGMVQHGGVLLGINNMAGYFGETLHDTDPGHLKSNWVTKQVSAVTAACLMIRKSDYELVGGLDEDGLPIAYNDVDLCLKVRKQNKHILWTPDAKLIHNESSTRGKDVTPQQQARAEREFGVFRARWGDLLLNDPAYNPNLNLVVNKGSFNGLALPPRAIMLR